MRTPLLILAALAVNFPAFQAVHAGDAKDAPPTLMLKPGKLLVSDDLKQPLGKGWFGKPGDWKVVDGVTRGAQRTEDMHAAVRRREVKFTSAVVEFQFRFDGAKAMSLSMNADKGHVCRVRITQDGFTMMRDKDKVNNDKGVTLDQRDIKIEPKAWHTMIVEMNGKDMLARLDGKTVGFGSNDGLTTPKASVGFTVQGDAMSFKNLRVYDGTLMPTWPATRDKLRAERKK